MEARLVHVAQGVGGAEVVLAYTAYALEQAGYSVHVDLLVGDAERIGSLLRSLNVRASLRSLRRNYTLKGFYRLQHMIYGLDYRLRIRGRVDVYVNTKADELPTVRIPAAKRIYYIHNPFLLTGDNPEEGGSLLRRWARSLLVSYGRRALAREAERGAVLLSNSEFTRDLLARVGLKTEVLHPPVDVDFFKACPAPAEREERVICVARLHPGKKLENCIRAVAASEKRPRLLMVGNSLPGYEWYIERLRGLAAEHGVELSIIADASKERLRGLLCGSRVSLSPLRGEHFGIAVVESMAAAVPPLAWDYGGPAYILPRRLLFRDLGEAGERIDWLLSLGEDEYWRLALDLRRRAERFNWRVFVGRLQALVRS